MKNKFNEKQKIDAYLLRQLYMKHGYEDAQKNDPLHIKACILYWAEGSKKPHAFEFTNCDPQTHVIILQFLRKYFPQLESKIRGCINFYPSVNNPYTKVLNYWANCISILPVQFTKPTDRSRYYDFPKNNKYPNGILRISISSVEVIYYIYGALNYYSNKEIFTPDTGR
jgi:hypothetical protein